MPLQILKRERAISVLTILEFDVLAYILDMLLFQDLGGGRTQGIPGVLRTKRHVQRRDLRRRPESCQKAMIGRDARIDAGPQLLTYPSVCLLSHQARPSLATGDCVATRCFRAAAAPRNARAAAARIARDLSAAPHPHTRSQRTSETSGVALEGDA